MHTKKHLNNWSSHSVYTYLILIILNFCSLMLNQHLPARAQTAISTIATDSCKITDSSAYLWGVVYYRGTAIDGVDISLNINGKVIETTTQAGDALPTYCISNTAIGEVAEITAQFAGQRITRSVRIAPGVDQKQQVNIVLPKRSIWDLWRVNTEINILKASRDGQFMIAGGQAGIIWLHKDTMQISSRNLIEVVDITNIHIPVLDKTIRDIAVHNNGLVWAITDEGLFRQQSTEETSWIKQSVPITGALTTLAINTDNGMVWVGGGESQREIARYLDGEWSHVYTTDEDIHGLTIDGQSNLWVGTWGSGVYKYDNQGEWLHYQADDGLASNYVHTIMPMTQKNQSEIVWFGTGYGVDSEGTQSGVGYYDITNNEWRTYGVEQGLPEKSDQAGVTEDIYIFTVDEGGIVWAGTEKGLYILGNDTPGQERWILHDEQVNGHVSALIAFNKTIVVATQNGLQRLIDNPELASFDSIRLQEAENTEGVLRLQVDSTSLASESTYAVWEWSSNHNGLLCTTSEACLFPTEKLKTGRHEIELRVQNETGGRTTSEKLHITIGHEVYLPAIRNSGQLPTFWY